MGRRGVTQVVQRTAPGFSAAAVLVMTILMLLSAPLSAYGAGGYFEWSTRADFERNASTTGEATTRSGILVQDSPSGLGLHDVVSVAGGVNYTAALRSDGTVVTVGASPGDVRGWTDIVAVAAGNAHVVGLKSDGTVVATGYNANGQTDVDSWTGVVAIAAGYETTFGVTADGTVLFAGWDKYGLSGVGAWTDIVSVAAALDHVVGLRSNGTVVARGVNWDGECDVSGWSNIVQIAAGDQHTLGLKSDGTVVAAGDQSRPYTRVGTWTGITQISAAVSSSVGLRADGTVLGGQPFVDGPWTDIVMVSAGWSHTLGVRSDGTVVASGENLYGECDTGLWADITRIAAGSSHTAGLRSDGTVVVAGINTAGQGDTDLWSGMVDVAAGGSHTVGLRPDGTVHAIGGNSEGQCNVGAWTGIVDVVASPFGTGGLKSDGTVVAVGGEDWSKSGSTSRTWTDIAAIYAGGARLYGIKTDGSVVVDGWIGFTGLGDVQDWADIVEVAPGGEQTIGLKSDGTVLALGANRSGECDVGSWENITSVAAGRNHTVGLKEDGTVMATGSNAWGQCDVDAWTDIIAIAAGDDHTVGVKSDGTVVAVGHSLWGQCRTQSGIGPLEVASARSGSLGGAGSAVGLRARGRVGLTGWSALHIEFPALEQGEAIKLAVRMSDDGVTWSDPLGSDGMPIDWTTGTGNYLGMDASDAAVRTDLSELPAAPYIDLVVRLESEGTGSPVLTRALLEYGSDGPLAAGQVPVAGAGRVETAIEASRLGFAPGSSEYAVIATARSFPDALGGSTLVGALDAPILLTEPGMLSTALSAEIARLGASHVIVLGGTGAVSADVFDALDALPGVDTIERVFGDDRYATAQAIARRSIAEMGIAWDGTAFVATGESFPDALGASPVAAAKGLPIYLVHPDPARHDSLVAAMHSDGVDEAIILGGTGPVPSSLETKLNGRFGDSYVQRLAGLNRYTTAVAVATYGVTMVGLSWDRVAIATGEDFPDALSGGALQGKSGSVMLLTHPGYLHTDVAAALSTHTASITEVRFLGGTGAVPQVVRDEVVQALQ